MPRKSSEPMYGKSPALSALDEVREHNSEMARKLREIDNPALCALLGGDAQLAAELAVNAYRTRHHFQGVKKPRPFEVVRVRRKRVRAS